MKVLVVGSNGMAGHVISKYLTEMGHAVSTTSRSYDSNYFLDVENTQVTSKFFNEISTSFDFIVNCVGLLVKDSIDRPDRAAIINGWLPHAIEQSVKNSKTRLIHLSTDCVFDGNRGLYNEKDIHTETNAYGKSKSYGEVNNDKDVTFRMSIIGPELKASGTGLMHWAINGPEKEINGWTNAKWNGITTLELAKCIEKYIQDPKITGVYHLVNNDNEISKYELLVKILKIFNVDKTVKISEGPKNINKILIDTRKLVNFDIPDYDQMLSELRDWYV